MKNLAFVEQSGVGATPIKMVVMGIASWLICVCVISEPVSASEDSFLQNYSLTYRAIIELGNRSISKESPLLETTLIELPPLPTWTPEMDAAIEPLPIIPAMEPSMAGQMDSLPIMEPELSYEPFNSDESNLDAQRELELPLME